MLESVLRPFLFAGRAMVMNRYAVYYAVICIVGFALTYWLMDMKKHFDMPAYLEGRENTFLTSLYTSALAQNNAMPDTTPKTNAARILFMAQVCLGWFWFLVLNPSLPLT